MRNYFFGTASHNTVMVEDQSQMLKGPRFIWYYWTQLKSIDIFESDKEYVIDATIKAYEHLDKGIMHNRKIIKFKNNKKWLVKDKIISKKTLHAKQIWHQSLKSNLSFSSNIHGKKNESLTSESWSSCKYGIKKKSKLIEFKFKNDIETEIYN